MIGERDLVSIDRDIARGKNVPTLLVGYETPELRPVRDDNYIMILNAFWRLFQSSFNQSFSIQDMVAYHEAFDLPCRLGWFIDAIQLVERIRREMSND
jgi:hypothetical protein